MNLINTNNNGEVVITLKEITDLIGVEHNKAMKKVVKLAEEPSFGQVDKMASSYTIGNGAIKTVETYALNKKQAIAVGAKLNNKLLMKVIDRLEELEKTKSQPKELTRKEIEEEILNETNNKTKD